jgi:hypothetical protein
VDFLIEFLSKLQIKFSKKLMENAQKFYNIKKPQNSIKTPQNPKKFNYQNGKKHPKKI